MAPMDAEEVAAVCCDQLTLYHDGLCLKGAAVEEGVAGKRRGMQLISLSRNIPSIKSGNVIYDLNKYNNIK